MKAIHVGIIAALALCACSKPASTVRTANASSRMPYGHDVATPDQAEQPKHNYTTKDGQDYAYVNDPTEEQKKRGAGGDVIMLRYLGREGELYRIGSVDIPDMQFTCANPCIIVKQYEHGRLSKRLDGRAGTLIDAAFADAINGQLDPVSSTSASVEGSAMEGTSPSDQTDAIAVSDVPTKFPKAMATWTRVTAENSDIEAAGAYATKLQGPADDLKPITVSGRTMLYGEVCKPHDCAGNTARFIIDPATQRIVGQVEATTNGGAITRKYAVITGTDPAPMRCFRAVYDGKDSC